MIPSRIKEKPSVGVCYNHIMDIIKAVEYIKRKVVLHESVIQRNQVSEP